MSNGGPGVMARLRQVFNNTCHYCGQQCNKKVGHPLQGTKDHIVPRYFGGTNSIENYVLACVSCNSRRGNSLDWCECHICTGRIAKALSSQRNLDFVFEGLVGFNKPRISKTRQGVWMVAVGTGRKTYKTFDEALSMALNGPDIRRNTR